MSLDALVIRLAELPERISALEAEIHDLKATIQNMTAPRPTYDARQLQEELGYSKGEAYEIMRTHGHKRLGRLRVTADNLIRYQEGQGKRELDSVGLP